jgi:hypothetical protein
MSKKILLLCHDLTTRLQLSATWSGAGVEMLAATSEDLPGLHHHRPWPARRPGRDPAARAHPEVTIIACFATYNDEAVGAAKAAGATTSPRAALSNAAWHACCIWRSEVPVHLLVDISAHGLGHLAQTAPVLNALRPLVPGSAPEPAQRLAIVQAGGARRGRIRAHRRGARFRFHDAQRGGHRSARQRVALSGVSRRLAARVADEADELRRRQVDAVLCNAAYLPLAAAAEAGIPAVGMSSLNWADMFAHYFGREPGPPRSMPRFLMPTTGGELLSASLRACRWPISRRIALGPVAGSGNAIAIFLSPAGIWTKAGAGCWWPWAAWISPWNSSTCRPRTFAG